MPKKPFVDFHDIRSRIAEATDLHRRWPQFSPEDRRRIIESIVERITLSDSEFDVTWS